MGRRWLSISGFALGLLLLIAAVWVVFSTKGLLDQTWLAFRQAPLPLLIVVWLLPIANLAVTALSFNILTNRHSKVLFHEMLALIWSASLLNQLPLKPGLIGRIGYHKAVNQIRIRDSIRVVAEVIFCAIAAAAAVLLLLITSSIFDFSTHSTCLILIFAPTLVITSALLLRRRTLRTQHPLLYADAWRYILCFGIRMIDLLIWTARYAALFAIVGSAINVRTATAVAVAGQGAMMLPVPVGLREWVVGTTSAILPQSTTATSPSPDLLNRAAPGVAADLLNRCIELSLILPGGLLASLWLKNKLQPSLAAYPAPNHSSSTKES